ncbi:hypothetical protein [Nonomuraea aridisoli]|uniref:Uncharacterized protein n=1 Tax=Nonomuraea aridisoli TaxID=2070368 RepID=A0A2W2EDP2_9ACTN|nr:hypothetical protein [Nonomuraea aridisoli]PZG22476.1 hypothetical protein C1J01_03500 [Nonomuraea aridisoli]
MANELSAKAAELGAAIVEHARVLEESPDDYPRVAQALNRLRSAALEYAERCADSTGWGNPFSDLEEDREEEAETAIPDGATVDVEAHYRIRVNDVAALTRLLGETAAEDVLGAPSDVVAQLFIRDGWDPAQYGGHLLTLVDQSWSCGPADADT